MSRHLEQYHRDVISGRERGAAASMLRGVLSVVEPFYGLASTARNKLYDRGMLTSCPADRPVVSVGNITTGGTGKTPVVYWLAQRVQEAGQTPAILLRGYRSTADHGSDEQRMLQAQLPGVIVEANPDRVEGARRVLRDHPNVNLFILDDGFQHRRLKRDFDLVLIDASNPFGFDHILPRGLRREPLAGLSRASAFLLTHVELSPGNIQRIENTLRQHNRIAPIFQCRHVQTSLRNADGASIAMAELSGKNVFTFCGIGNPQGFDSQIESAGARRVGSHWFGDHHPHTPDDLAQLHDQCRQLGADVLVTTEKDWIKIAALASSMPDLPPIWRTELTTQFTGEDESRLLALIRAEIESSLAASVPRQPVGR